MFSAEFAQSMVTENTMLPDSTKINQPVFSTFGFRANQSSSVHSAYNAKLNYVGKGYTIGGAYEKIDAGYQTYGAYYFNNDIENYTLNTTRTLFKGKVNIGLNGGLQRTNLSSEKLSSMNRYLFACNIQYAISKRVNANFTYSNFQSYTRVRQLSQVENSNLPRELNGNPDTLNFVQISQSMGGSVVWGLSNPVNKTIKKTMTFNSNYQTSSDNTSQNGANAGVQFVNTNINYSQQFVPQAFNFGIGINSSYNGSTAGSLILLGPVGNVTKSFFAKKLKVALNCTFSNTLRQGVRTGYVVNSRITCNYTFLKKHSFNSYLTFIHKDELYSGRRTTFSELTFNSGYSYSF